MSELKVHTIYTPMDDVAHDEKGKILEGQEVYLKSEVDRVIAEKDAKIIQLEALIENYNRISGEIIDNANHHKYKRCLAMARWCKAEQTYSSFAIYITEHPESRWANKSVGAGNWIAFWKNREQRWLELAEKFKPNKEAK